MTVPAPCAVPSTKASLVETKVTEAALKPAGAAARGGAGGDAAGLGVAGALAVGGGLGAVLAPELGDVEPHAAAAISSARHAATSRTGLTMRVTMVTSLSNRL